MSKRHAFWILVAVCLLAYVLRVLYLDGQSLWRDEVDAIRFANRPVDLLLGTFRTPGENGPLYYLLLRPWLVLAGLSEFSLRFFSLFFGVLAVPLTYRLARRLFPSSRAVGLVAALLMATLPYLVWYGQEGKMYTLVVILVLLSTDRFLAAIQKGGWQRWLAYIVVTSICFYVHLMTVLIIPVQVMAFFLLGRDRMRASWKGWLTSLAVLIVPYLPLLTWQLPLVFEPAETGFRFLPLPQMARSLFVNYSLGVVQQATPWLLAAFVLALGLAALAVVGHRANLRSFGIILIWLTVPVLGLFFVSLVRPLYTARYLIYVVPAFALLLALGIAGVGRRSVLVSVAILCALLVANGFGLWRQATNPIKADFRGATRYVMGRLLPGDLVLFQIPYGRHSFEHYARIQSSEPHVGRNHAGNLKDGFQVFLPLATAGPAGGYKWADGLYTNAGMDEVTVDSGMQRIVSDSDRVWLVATEMAMWDERGLTEAWLRERGTVAEQAVFTRVTVTRFDLGSASP